MDGGFFERNRQALADYVRLSTEPGARADYVQGGGGNTSCKFDDRHMAIKASGFRLTQVATDNGYAVLDYAAIRRFYAATDPSSLEDVEKAGSDAAKASIQSIEGLPALRPSVEAGFHSLLDRFVLHTHPVYANLATCCTTGRDIVARVLADRPYSYGYVSYINPGASLTFSIAAEIARVVRETGRRPAVLFMQNHGFIATHEDPDACIALHAEVNRLVAGAFGVTDRDYPDVAVAPVDSRAGMLRSDTPWLQEALRTCGLPQSFFTVDALYPDQLVYLAGTFAIVDGAPAGGCPDPSAMPARVVAYRETGDVFYHCGETEARTIEETLAAILYIVRTVESRGLVVSRMSDAGKDFIANWESEKYRKNLTAK